MNSLQRIRGFREAGAVQRCHTVPHIGGYSVAEHTWQLMMLLYHFHPDPIRPQLLYAAMHHDVAERWTGDSPATAKWASPMLNQALEDMERKIEGHLNIEWDLSGEEKMWLKSCDLLELYMWAADQLAMGNQHVTNIIKNIDEWFYAHEKEIPTAVWIYWRYFEWGRSSDKALPGTEFVA